MAFTGKARNNVTPNPRKKYCIPCSLYIARNMYTIRLFSIGVVSGAVCILVFTTSKGYINAHVSAPEHPPANADAAHSKLE